VNSPKGLKDKDVQMKIAMRHDELVDFLREIHARPGGVGAILNLIRAAKVRAAADINALTDVVSEVELKLDLARHGCDEARHAYMLIRRMHDLGFHPFRVPPALDRVGELLDRSRARDPKQVYSERGRVSEAELLEFAVAGLLTEQDSVVKLRANHDALRDDRETRAVIGHILLDEERHVAYLTTWLERFEQRFSPRAVAKTRERLGDVLRQLDQVYYDALADYFERAVERSMAAA
jgi:bacterioferritin (cytochrome b1)